MTEKSNKSVSNLLDKVFGPLRLYEGGKRGKVLHEAWTRFNAEIFKTNGYCNKINYRVFSQRITKVYNDIISGKFLSNAIRNIVLPFKQ